MMDLRVRRRIGLSLASLALLAGAAFAPSPARAQCVNDGFDSAPCCTPVVPTLPVFPAISQTSRFICFRDCAPIVNQGLCVDIDPPQPVTAGGGVVCGLYTIRFKIRLCGGAQNILWQGTLRAHYSRNWQEFDPTIPFHGVYRFLLNGDLKPTSFLLTSAQGSNPNVVPVCRASFANNVYFGGYIDYAFDCLTATWKAAWAVNHDCDTFHHQTGQPRPAPAAGFHPTRSFTFLGPGAGFVVNATTTPIPVGPVTRDAVRWNDWSTLPNICRGEEPMAGAVQSFGSFCLCTTSGTAPAQYEVTDVNVLGTCGSAVQPSPIAFVSKRVGQWTNPTLFPGVEDLNFQLGFLGFQNGCTTQNSLEFYEGVTTFGGFPASDWGFASLGTVFMDLGSSNKNPASMQPRIGVPHVTQSIVNLNLP